MTEREIKSFIDKTIKAPAFEGCSYIWLDDTYALVFAWQDESLNGKVAYNNGILQCDYDFDWYMPEVNGDIMDTEVLDCVECNVDTLYRWFIEEIYNTIIS